MINNKYKSTLHENINSDTMIIFVHGILEGPNQFYELSRIAHKNNFSFSNILLPGHGSSGRDFANSNKSQWIKALDDEILKFQYFYKNIILVGHSMGGLLSILSSLKYKDKIKGLVLISTPLRVFVKFNIMISSLKIALGLIKENDFLTNKANDAFCIERSSFLTYITWVPRYLDLFSLMISVKNVLRDLEIPTLLVHTEKDELVSCKSINIFKKHLGNDYKILNLKKSGHFYYDKDDFSYLLNEFELFLNNLYNN